MKIYHDNSAKILHSSECHHKIRRALQTIVVITGCIFLLYDLLCLILKVNNLKPKTAVTIFGWSCFVACLLILLILGVFDDLGYEKIHISTDKLCLVKRDFRETLAIIAGEQDLYLNTLNYEYELIPVQQSLKFRLAYDYCLAPPEKPPTSSWQQFLLQLAKIEIPNVKTANTCYQAYAYFVLDFYISPQALTDAGRHALILNLDVMESLSKTMSLWLLAGFQVTESGNLEIAQEYLDRNPYGFCEMRVKFIRTAYRADKTITVI